MRIFFGYPSVAPDLMQTISAASKMANKKNDLHVQTWQANDIIGRDISYEIFDQIEKCDAFACDITKLNFNVTFELGYSIARGKKVLIYKNKTFVAERDLVKEIGIFDTLGFSDYETFPQLADKLKDARANQSSYPVKPKDTRVPVYVLGLPQRGDFGHALISSVKKARLNYRGFDPSEQYRLSAFDAIGDVSAALATVVPLLDEHVNQSFVHNIRAGFVSGLSIGYGIHTLIIQHGAGTVPFDILNFVKRVKHPGEIKEHVNELALAVTEQLQETKAVERPPEGTLAKLDIGQPTAENEFQSLHQYYLTTDEFSRVLSGEISMVVGRKGTGKTALFSQVRNDLRRNRANIILDLKPEGYQLEKLKDQVLDYLEAGSKTHLITAFWEYIILLEIAYKLLEKDEQRIGRDPRIEAPYRKLEAIYLKNYTIEGDFSERMNFITGTIVQNYKQKFDIKGQGSRLTNDDVTYLLYNHDLAELKTAVAEYLALKETVFVLIDNLDKPWSTHGLSKEDIVIIRAVIDASRKLQRDFRKSFLNYHGVIFLRNDVHHLLIEETADRGKESRVSLDWREPELLRELLRLRFEHAGLGDIPLEDQFSKIAISHYDGEETIQWMIDRSLMRPRFLINLIKHCRGSAVNFKHDRIEEGDIERGFDAYSQDLITETNLELRDIYPKADGLIYEFLEEKKQISDEDLQAVLARYFGEDDIDNAKYFLIWHGFIGLEKADLDIAYIYNVGYDMNKMKAYERRLGSGNIVYQINPAFWSGLEITE